MKTIRSFLALDLSLATARALADLQRTLADRLSGTRTRVRWVAPQNLHVTIAFLGQVTEPMTASLSNLLAPAAAAVAPFDMTCGGLGAFPDERHPRVLWAGVTSPAEELEGLHRRVTEILGETGFDMKDELFRSHVTIGRVREVEDGGLAPCFDEDLSGDFGRTRVKDLACYRSDLDPRGADYHLLWRLPLTGRSAAAEPQAKE